MPSSRAIAVTCLVVCLGIFHRSTSLAEPDSAQDHQDHQEAARRVALSRLNPLIGQWRGVGRPQRYQTAGTWREKADWVWDFAADGPRFKYAVTDGKELKAAELTWDVNKKHFSLHAKHASGVDRIYHGLLDGKKLLLTSQPDKDGDVYRFQVTMLNPKRTLVLYQKQKNGRGSFHRINEVGHTRQGTRLAKDKLGGPECVVTGGLGTIKVSHDGKDYFVCCTGCRDAFNEDPEKTLTAYRERIAKRKAKEREAAAGEQRLLTGETEDG